MKLKGKSWKFGDGISTDDIAPGKYFHLRSNLPELAKHVLEVPRPEFQKKVKKGDFVVGGKNFGLGSSREHAPRIMKIAGVSAVLAKSFARIFYRNCINVGLPAITVDTSKIREGDILEVDLEKGVVKNKTRKTGLGFKPMPRVMTEILRSGGLVPYIRKNRDFKLR